MPCAALQPTFSLQATFAVFGRRGALVLMQHRGAFVLVLMHQECLHELHYANAPIISAIHLRS
jgi:hypothetical protein